MRLHEYIELHRNDVFEWGSNDCVIFVTQWVFLKTGVDHLADLPTWKNEKEALRVIKKCGGLKKAFDDRFKAIEPSFGKDGDIALVRGNMALFSGIHLVGPSIMGTQFLSRMDAECAWSVG